MSLSADIKNGIASLRARCDEFSSALDALKTLLPQGERAAQIFTNARATLGYVRTEIMELETTLSVVRQTAEPGTALTPALSQGERETAAAAAAEDGGELDIPTWLRKRARRVASRPRMVRGKAAAAGEREEAEGVGDLGLVFGETSPATNAQPLTTADERRPA